ncbi:DUF3658 domain-containing protein [Bradyrhizobium roseum]|uniref:DUF3658 domain-containing protein n=1 Tax=Bradyrhizobium roseum TaxID=3056648 RepID=UPI0026182CAD|nr:DUF3658 domain-containing protein [Bradyrhizobium roseus]WKA28927.1 DUF3658 domain-containing protein [Bradyrhizobium roseus]
MKREQAVRIQKHVLDADAALDRARTAIADLGKKERLALDGLLQEAVETLHLELLEEIYAQYPDLEPTPMEEEVPAISSTLTWDQVRLPPSVTEADLDSIILSSLKPQWQKTAMVVFRAMDRCEERGLPIGDEAIAARLQVLAASDRIEGIGDLRKWRHSEVRLKD